MNYQTILTKLKLIVPALAILLQLACGGHVKDPNAGSEFTPPAEITTKKINVAPAATEFILLDISGTVATFLPQMATEVAGLTASLPADHQVVVAQISGDSRATASPPWKRGLLEQITCERYGVFKTAKFKGSAEETAYKEAAKRQDAENTACLSEKDKKDKAAAARMGRSLPAWLKALKPTSYTDIGGAIDRSLRMKEPEVPVTIWIYSDMKEELASGVKAAEALDLSDVTVNIRLVSRAGQSEEAQRNLAAWQAKLEGWGATVEWKEFYSGEFTLTE